MITEPEWTPGGVYDFCRNRNRTWSRIFEWKPDPEQEWEFPFWTLISKRLPTRKCALYNATSRGGFLAISTPIALIKAFHHVRTCGPVRMIKFRGVDCKHGADGCRRKFPLVWVKTQCTSSDESSGAGVTFLGAGVKKVTPITSATQIPAQSTLEFYIIITSMLRNSSIIMSIHQRNHLNLFFS